MGFYGYRACLIVCGPALLWAAPMATALGIAELAYPVGKKLLGHRWTVTS